MAPRIVLLLVLQAAAATLAAASLLPQEGASSSSSPSSSSRSVPAPDCLASAADHSLYCRGARVLRNIIRNLSKSDKPIVLLRGLEIVPSIDNTVDANADADAETANNSKTVLDYFSHYLRTHELNIKFSDILAHESRQPSMARTLLATSAEVEARKKDKGLGVILAMALMFGKMMTVMGLSGIGGIALKALSIASAALLLAGIIGLKSLAGQGHEGGHSVSYVTPADGHHPYQHQHQHHHRRRRRGAGRGGSGHADADADAWDSLPLVYGAWMNSLTQD